MAAGPAGPESHQPQIFALHTVQGLESHIRPQKATDHMQSQHQWLLVRMGLGRVSYE